ncbi:GNAT family N-acetyltransferase [Celerinatantimonas yamalensis]|uniref:GNAT family N-acetyltransferase n=1 Tax=Celerinatantimonas yamalensis TaxID=559956 RepID=A0ABW9GB44_9GAMM
MEFVKSENFEGAISAIKEAMAFDYEKLGLEWDDAKKLVQYQKCSLWNISVEGEVVGFNMVYEHSGVFYLAELHIGSCYRGKGFGTEALRKIKSVASMQGYSEVRVGAFKEGRALKLYERNGFVREKETELTYELVANT